MTRSSGASATSRCDVQGFVPFISQIKSNQPSLMAKAGCRFFRKSRYDCSRRMRAAVACGAVRSVQFCGADKRWSQCAYEKLTFLPRIALHQHIRYFPAACFAKIRRGGQKILYQQALCIPGKLLQNPPGGITEKARCALMGMNRIHAEQRTYIFYRPCTIWDLERANLIQAVRAKAWTIIQTCFIIRYK